MSTPLKVCLLAAGCGTRSSGMVGLHKALLPLGNRAAISRLLDAFPCDTEFVVALGSRGHQLRAYLSFAHHNRKFTFVDVDNFDGIGSGPGRSLIACKPHLDGQFVFTSIDTVVAGATIDASSNWIGVADDIAGPYCRAWVAADGNVTALGSSIDGKPFVGIAGVYDTSVFWDALQSSSLEHGEIQVITGLRALMKHGLAVRHMTWSDVGHAGAYERAMKLFLSARVTEQKPDEITFVERDRVIKCCADPARIRRRVERARLLCGVVPNVIELCDGMCGYEFVEGKLLSEVTDDVHAAFWEFCRRRFTPALRTQFEQQQMFSDCDDMYRVKTYDRLALLERDMRDIVSSAVTINGVECPSLRSLVDNIPFSEIVHSSIAHVFHGDLQPENIVWTGDRFVLIDWRESFGASTCLGDVYYDLAKLHHASIVNGAIVRDGRYNVTATSPRHFMVAIERSPVLIKLLDGLRTFCSQSGYDYTLVKLISALTFINIAPLNSGRYRTFLVLFGMFELHKALKVWNDRTGKAD